MSSLLQLPKREDSTYSSAFQTIKNLTNDYNDTRFSKNYRGSKSVNSSAGVVTSVSTHGGTDYVMVKKAFRYKQPTYYRVQYSKPCLFPTGCLTCGRKNAIVQYYGERYCCAVCKKYL